MMLSKFFSKPGSSSGIFLPSGNCFVELTDTNENTSINSIARHLGYCSEQIHAMVGVEKSTVQAIVFEFFTDKIILSAHQPLL